MFGLPILSKLLGTKGPVKAILKVKITEDIRIHKDFLTFVRVIVYRDNDVFLARPVSASGPQPDYYVDKFKRDCNCGWSNHSW